MFIGGERMRKNVKKIDVRSKYTQSLIQKALITLLTKESINEITIKELCLTAGISRGTFYNQFFDVYDVYETIEDESYNEIVKRVETGKVYSFDSKFFLDMLYYIVSNKDWFMIIFSNINSSKLATRIISYLKSKFIKEFKELNPKLDEGILNTVFTYSITGSIGIVSQWLNEGAKVDPTLMAKEISALIKVTFEGYIKETKTLLA
jgi:AcrR family transcriptional regulator